MRILLVRIFYYYAFSLYLSSYLLQVPTYGGIRKREKKKKTMFGADFSYLFFLIPSQA